MRFHTAVTAFLFAGALVAVPQLAAAACFSSTDVKTNHADVVKDINNNTVITLDGVCYGLVGKVFLGQQNGALVQVIAPPASIADNGTNQIVVTLPSLLPAGDYLVELRNNANAFAGSVFLTVPDLAATSGATGYEQVAGTTSSNNSSAKTATATCPNGKKVVGGGWNTPSQSGFPPFVLSSRATSDTVWTVTTTLALGSFSLQAFAICINAEADAS